MTGASEPWPLGHRPALDGFRALAVSLVLLQHITLTADWNLGATGVGLFFALSGYLITGMLLDEFNESGTVGLRRFYLRRAARLMPALLLMVSICSAAFLGLGHVAAVVAAVPAVGYYMNYAVVLEGEFLPAFGHTWSLAVEEHFYIAWPLVLLFLLRRWSLRRVVWVTIGICAAVFAWRLVVVEMGGPTRLLYVGSVERADALLYGCVAAMLVRLGWRPARWLVFAGLAVTMLFVMLNGAVTGVAQGVFAVGAAAVVVGLDHGHSAVLRLLSGRVVVALGTWSYGIYLWHLPVLTYGRSVGADSLLARALLAGLAIGCAAISYRWVEAPIRGVVRARTSVGAVEGRLRDEADQLCSRGSMLSPSHQPSTSASCMTAPPHHFTKGPVGTGTDGSTRKRSTDTN